jgi:hypothetical protein
VYTAKECSRDVYCGGVFQGCILWRSVSGVYTVEECSRDVYCGGVFQGCIYCGGVLVDRLEEEICTGRREKKEKMMGTVQRKEGKRQHVKGYIFTTGGVNM